jgi:hypothetical protein
VKSKWRGHKRENEHERGEDGKDLPFAPEGLFRLNEHGMTKA